MTADLRAAHCATSGRRTGVLGPVPGWVVAGAVYLGAAVAMWWRVWSGHPSSTMTCACGDPASFVWFLNWPAYAISHGQSLFFSTWVHVPGGINLLDNTSVLALGVVLAPVTWLAGPVLSLNVALTAAPAAAGLSAYGVLRRGLGVRWPAAFLGGLMFGFSPFVLRNEAMNHLQSSFVALVPLIFWACYELAVAQRGRWWGWGLALGLLVSVQFFIGPEVLTVIAFTVAVALGLAAVAALSRPGVLAAKLPFAWRGFGLAGVVAAVLLAYPLWFSLAGPEHITGPVWPRAHSNALELALLPLGRTLNYQRSWQSAGYLGPLGTAEGYLGIAALVVLAVAVVLVRRPLVKLCAAITGMALWLSLGSSGVPLREGGEPGWLPLPWRAFDHLPVLTKLAPATFSVVGQWCVIVAGVLLVDELLRARTPAGQVSGRLGFLGADAGRARAAAAAAVVASVALAVPWLLAWRIPYTTEPVPASPWAARSDGHVPAGAVVLFYPFPATYLDKAIIWQAESGMRYAIVGGRGITATGNGAADHGFTTGTPEGTMSALSTLRLPAHHVKTPPLPGPDAVRSFRAVLRRWGVTEVVMTTGGRHPAYARQWFTLVLGTPPRQQDGTWVWSKVQRLVS